MSVFVDYPAAEDGSHFVDTVGKLIAAVLDMDLRLGMRNILAVDIGYSRHDRLVSSKELETDGKQFFELFDRRCGGEHHDPVMNGDDAVAARNDDFTVA